VGMARKITVLLMGGLGNQMFQYAAGFSLAKKNNAQLFLDTTLLNDRFPRKEFTFRTLDLDIFGIAPNFTTFSKVSQAMPIPGVWLGIDYSLIKARDVLGIQKTIKERSPVFDPDIFNMESNALLFGYWQSEKYFENVKDDLRAVFDFKIPLAGVAKEIAEKIKSTNSVALFVRRGDYVNFARVRAEMGDTNITYYKNAITYIAERVNNPAFFIFSNDIEWCRDNLKIPFPAMYIDNDPAKVGPKFSYQLQHMSLCKHNIIANSTFPWWGAWLNPNPQKIVIAPRQWNLLLPSGQGPVPSDWIKM